MDLQAPYLGNQTQDQYPLTFPASLIEVIGRAYLRGMQPAYGYTKPRVYQILSPVVPVGTISLSFELEGQGWMIFTHRYTNPLRKGTAYMQGPFVLDTADRKVRWEVPGDMMDAILTQLTNAIAGDPVADVQGQITVYYDSSLDFRGNGMDLGSPTKEY